MKLSQGLLSVAILLLHCVPGLAQPLGSSVPDPPTSHCYFRLEKPLNGFSDKLRLKSGEIRIGKVLEWGTLVYFWNHATSERYAYERDEVQNFEISRADEVKKKPNLPDLTVAFIERTPRDQGWHGIVGYDEEGRRGLPFLKIDPRDYQLHPAPGQEVTFTVHILNAGLASSKSFQYEILMDDEIINAGTVKKPIKPGKTRLVSITWSWQEGEHYITVRLDTESANTEIAKWNNTFIDPVRALTFFFAVSRNTYEGFANNLNLVDTFNFEDWAQYHVHMMNWLFMNSIWPSAPDGILERVRIDNIVVVEDARDEETSRQLSNAKSRFEHTGEITMYNGIWEFGKVRDEAHAARWAQQADWGLPHELGHQLGLVDEYWLNHDPWEILVRNKHGYYANFKHFFPWPKTMMHWHGPHIFSESCAGYLNRTLGRPRGYFGDYYYQIPKKNCLEVLSNTGKPLAGVEITVCQPWIDPSSSFIPKPDWKEYAWAFGPEPIFSGKTDKDGLYFMPNRKTPRCKTPEPGGYELRDNPWGQVNVVGDNCVLLAKLSYAESEEFHWLKLYDFNIAAIRGHDDEFTHKIHTRFPGPGAPEPPAEVRPVWYRQPRGVQMGLLWKPSPSPSVVEYRLYRKSSIGGHSVKPFRLYHIVPADKLHGDGWYHGHGELHKEFRWQGHYRTDSYFAVTAVDTNGLESRLSYTIFVPKVPGSCKLAVGPDGQVYVTFYEGRDVQILIWDGQYSYKEMGLRPKIRNYNPGFQGICVDAKGRLVTTDQWAHQVVIYDLKGDLVKIIGNPQRQRSDKDGEFNWPSDVAVDGKGRIYVADTHNHRIQVFDGELNYLGKFGSKGDGEMQFSEPSALSATGDKLTVTDRKGRVLIFDVSGNEPKQILEIPNLRAPDRALIAPSGRIHICAHDENGRSAVRVFNEDGTFRRNIYGGEGGQLHNPRGLYPDGKGHAYVVNDFPYEVVRIRLE